MELGPLERIVDRLIGTDGLLIVDNCEHVAPGVARLVRALLEAAPDVRVLATSRVTLGIVGESGSGKSHLARWIHEGGRSAPADP